MKNVLADLFLVNGINGASIAVLTLNDVKDVVAIALGVISIISTLLIIRENLRKSRKSLAIFFAHTSLLNRGETHEGIPSLIRAASERKIFANLGW